MQKMLGRCASLVLATMLTVAAAGAPAAGAERPQIRIAAEYGLGYAPLFIVAKKLDFIRKYIPDVDVSLIQLAGGAAVREALLSNTVDIGGLAMPPVIQAWAKGTDLRIALGMSDMPVELITYRPDITSVKQLKPGDKINVVSIGSPQTLIVKMAAEKYFGSPEALDGNFVALPHPDGVSAVLAKRDIVAEFATPPYIRQLRGPGMHSILSDRDFPDAHFMLIVAASTEHFEKQQPKLYAALIHATKDAIAWLTKNPKEAADFLAAEQAGKLTPAEWLAEIKQPGVKFSAVPHGLGRLATFMAGIHMIPKAGRYDELTLPNLHDVGGN
ncbi:MAG: ABC transporter substrate-binding protein [Vulcanimicrobiaceae bacterium]